MKYYKLLLSGLAGSAVLTLVHELTRNSTGNAPRMDLMGEQALTKIFHKAGEDAPEGKALYWSTMLADLTLNALTYSLIGLGSKKWLWAKGSGLGSLLGLGALVLPKPLGLNEKYSNRSTKTQVLTTAYYLLGSLVATAVIQAFFSKKEG